MNVKVDINIGLVPDGKVDGLEDAKLVGRLAANLAAKGQRLQALKVLSVGFGLQLFEAKGILDGLIPEDARRQPGRPPSLEHGDKVTVDGTLFTVRVDPDDEFRGLVHLHSEG